MALIDRLNAFRQSVSDSRGLIVAAHAADAAGVPLWAAKHRTTITQAAFLSIFIAWEHFLESCFADYMTGEPSASGNLVTRWASPPSADHAKAMLIGTQKYADYGNPDIARRMAKLVFLAGQPFETVIASLSASLFDIRTIRNSAAHLSSTTSTALDSLATRLLQKPTTNITVYDLLLSTDPKSPTKGTVLSGFILLLESAAYQIVHH